MQNVWGGEDSRIWEGNPLKQKKPDHGHNVITMMRTMRNPWFESRGVFGVSHGSRWG